MLWQMTRDRSQFEKTDKIIDAWLKERQALLVLYHQIAGITPFADGVAKDDKELMIRFCQTLIDYVSAGHFEVFEKIAEISAAQQEDHLGLDREVLVKISRTTLQALKFNDACAFKAQWSDLRHDLSLLGEYLAHRFDLEDELVTSYIRARDSKKNTPDKHRLKL